MKKFFTVLFVLILLGAVAFVAFNFDDIYQYISDQIPGDDPYEEYGSEEEKTDSDENQEPIPDDHICRFGDWTLLKMPTHSKEGEETRSCYCGKTETQAVSCLGYDGLTYVVNADGKSCTIIGMGSFTGEHLVIGSFIDGYRVDTIAAEAFQNCTGLKSVVVPSTVIYIDPRTFADCTALESLTIPFIGSAKNDPGFKYFMEIFGYTNDDIPVSLKSVTVTLVTDISPYAFKNCSTIERITFSNDITSIGQEAFLGCAALSNVTLPNSVESIGDYAFAECDSLSQFTLSNSLHSIGSFAFIKCSSLASIVVPDSVIRIGEGAFILCDNLSKVTLSNSLRCVESNMFWGCTALESIAIPYGVRVIGTSAFGNCSNLTSVTLPNSIINIGEFAFEDCSKIKSIIIPSSTISIGENVFVNCSNLADITVLDHLELRENMFYGCDKLVQKENGVFYVGKWVIGCDKTVTDVELREGTIGIGSGAFSDCNNLVSVEFSNSTKIIGESAFAGCDALTSVTMSSQTTIIGNNAFGSCSALKTITLPNSVTSIGNYAFGGCSSLSNLTIPNSVVNIGTNAFVDCNQLFSEEEGIIYVDKWVIDCDESITAVILRPDTVGFANSAFEDCKQLTSIIIPDGFISIGADVFYQCDSLTNIVLPESVVSIGDRSFWGCSNLVSITMPKGLVSIGLSAFYDCSSLADITIPSSVKNIGEYAFKGCDQLLQEEDGLFYVDKWLVDSDTVAPTLTLRPDTVGIADSAFYSTYYYYKDLISITMPSSVASIGKYAFCHCENLTSITFCGSMEQWGAIEKGSEWNSYIPIFTVHCTDGDISK